MPASSKAHSVAAHTVLILSCRSMFMTSLPLRVCRLRTVVWWSEGLQLLQALHRFYRLDGGVIDVRRVEAAALLEGVFWRGIHVEHSRITGSSHCLLLSI